MKLVGSTCCINLKSANSFHTYTHQVITVYNNYAYTLDIVIEYQKDIKVN